MDLDRRELEWISDSLTYRVYTSLEIGQIGVNPPKSPLKRGTKTLILSPFLRGFGGFRSKNEV
jgi:hypothetical protein